MLKKIQWVAVLAAMFWAGAIGLPRLAHLVGLGLHHHQTAAVMKLGNAPAPAPATYDGLGQYDFAAFVQGWWQLDGMDEFEFQGRKRNTKFQAGSYLSVFALAQWMEAAAPDRLPGDWARTMRPFQAMTTEGDTAIIYPKAHVVNYLMPGAVDSALAVWGRHLGRDQAPQVKWLMLDFISSPLPDLKRGQEPWESLEHGALDLDQDGIDHWNDKGEQVAWRQAMMDVLIRLRSQHPHLLLVANGGLAITDRNISALLDGCYVEGFPQWFFGGAFEYRNALDPDFPHSLWALTEQGRWHSSPGLVMVEDTQGSGIPGWLSAMWPGLVEMRRPINGDPWPAPIDLMDLGKPIAAAVWVDSTSTICRQFENGTACVEVISNRQAIGGIR